MSRSASGTTGRNRPSTGCRRLRETRWPARSWSSSCSCSCSTCAPRTWIAVGIPFSFIGSLLFFGPAGLTLNLGTLIGFFLMVGLVVDDAVVVGESIIAERDKGKRGSGGGRRGAPGR